MEYSLEELNEILLRKKVEDFYLAIVEKRPDKELTIEEFDRIVGNDGTVYTDFPKEMLFDIFGKIQQHNRIKHRAFEILRKFYSTAQIRRVSIATMIDGKVYDIGLPGFIDLDLNRVIHYDRLTMYYDDTNARITLVTDEEFPGLKREIAAFDVDDESKINDFERAYIHQKETTDLTEDFLKALRKKQNRI